VNRGCATVFLTVLLSACAREFPNQPLSAHDSNSYLSQLAQAPEPAPDDPFIVMTFSGGGVRATALAYDVLELLKHARYSSHGQERRLIDDVRILSSASGGSVTAAWFGLKGPDGLDGLKPSFLAKDNMGAMIGTGLNPVTWVRLASPNFARVDVLREYLDDDLFHKAAYRDLYSRPGAPLVILNATDMSTGEVFDITPQRFDDICSDLGAFPLATAVASSAAFPVLLTPMTLKNWSGPGCPVEQNPKDISVVLGSKDSRFANPSDFMEAQRADRLRRHQQEFVHLLDGGLADNIGATSALTSLFGVKFSGEGLGKINTGLIKNLVIIAVNARSDPDKTLDRQESTPGVVSVIGSVISAPIDSASRGSMNKLTDRVEQLKAAIRSVRETGVPEDFPDFVYGVQIDFDQFDITDSSQIDLRYKVKNIPTSWTIDAEALSNLDLAAETLLVQHPCFRALRKQLHVTFDDPAIEKRMPAAEDHDDLCGADVRH
jgi:NTE family protein